MMYHCYVTITSPCRICNIIMFKEPITIFLITGTWNFQVVIKLCRLRECKFSLAESNFCPNR